MERASGVKGAAGAEEAWTHADWMRLRRAEEAKRSGPEGQVEEFRFDSQ